MAKEKSWFECNRDEIYYNIINSLLAGLLVFFGSLVGDGFKPSLQGVGFALITAIIVMITKFKDYWATQEQELCKDKKVNLKVGFFNFI